MNETMNQKTVAAVKNLTKDYGGNKGIKRN